MVIPNLGKSPRRDLNSRPLVYKTSALTTELRRRDIWVATHDQTNNLRDDISIWNKSWIWIESQTVLVQRPFAFSRVAQRKRAGPITQRSVDRNHPLLRTPFRFSNVDSEFHFLTISKMGPVRESNPGPRAPEARIIPLDQQAIAFISQTKGGKHEQL